MPSPISGMVGVGMGTLLVGSFLEEFLEPLLEPWKSVLGCLAGGVWFGRLWLVLTS